MGTFQTIVPKRSEVGIRPSLMIRTTATTATMGAAAKDASQTHTYPFIEVLEKKAASVVLEVGKPPTQGAAHVRNNVPHTVSRGAFGLGPNRLLELANAFLPRPVFPVMEGVTQEVKVRLAR